MKLNPKAQSPKVTPFKAAALSCQKCFQKWSMLINGAVKINVPATVAKYLMPLICLMILGVKS
jgi:hypothetical protein